MNASQQARWSWVYPSQLPIDVATEVIVDSGTLVLVRNGESYSRGSALNEQQIAEITGPPR